MKTIHPLGAKLPHGFVAVPKYKADQIAKFQEFVRKLEAQTFVGIPHGEKETLDTYLKLLEDLKAEVGIGHVRATTAWGPIATEPQPYTAEGFLCSTGRHFYITQQHGENWAKHLAAHCCGPYKCHRCDAESDKSNTYCASCLNARKTEAWLKAERVEAPAGAMIYADRTGTFYRDMDEFMEHCYDEEIADPYDLRPFICELQVTRTPNLSEIIGDEMHDEWDGREDWLDELQDAIDAAFKKHQPGGWCPGSEVPLIATQPEVTA